MIYYKGRKMVGQSRLWDQNPIAAFVLVCAGGAQGCDPRLFLPGGLKAECPQFQGQE